MPNSITYLVSDLVDQVRVESDLNLSQVFTNDDLAVVISDAGSELRDIFTGTNQYYDVSTFDFQLTGGVGLNSVVLPQDFQAGHSIDVNPDTQTPFTLRYLPNWLNRNSYSMPFQVFGNNFGPKAYTFLGNEIVVLPAIYAQGLYRLYYTPTWTPLARPVTVAVETASISIPVTPLHTGISGGGTRFLVNDASPATVFLATDVGNSLIFRGTVSNNDTVTITAFVDANSVDFTPTGVAETFPSNATVTLLRNSRVSNAGAWTFYGDNPFSNATIAVKVGDVMTVSGTPSNDGTYTISADATGGNIITTGGTTVAENFPNVVTVTIQPLGTRATLPQNMNPWVQYLKTQAIISVRVKRGQPVESFEARLQVQKDRIQTILQDRHDEPSQPPLLRGGNDTFGGGGGGWGAW